MKSNKTISMSIRVNEDELERIKKAAELSAYAGYSEFVRRTALMEASKVIKEKEGESSLDSLELKGETQ